MERDITRFWILIIAELSVLRLLVFPVASQSPDGFISIDCGGPGGRDEVTGLDWVGDREYLLGADQLAKEGVAVNATVTLTASPTPRDNAERLTTALVFSPGNLARPPRSKYCYHLFINTGPDFRYLIRATFPGRNLTATGQDISSSVYATRFYFSVDSTYIATVELDEFEPQSIEVIFSLIDLDVNVCLVPLEDRSSMPAISALELRILGFLSYQNLGFLMTLSRLNFGGDSNKPSIRYPDDKYDRLWSAPSIPSTDVQAIVNTTVVDLSRPQVDYLVEPPEKVMSTAWEGISLASEILLTLNFSNPRTGQPMKMFPYGLLFYDILERSSVNVTRIVDFLKVYHEYTAGSVVSPLADFEIAEGWSILNYDQITGYEWPTADQQNQRYMTESTIKYTISANVNSTRPAMINALEIYGQVNAVTEKTVQEDGAAVKDLAGQFLDRLDGTADPCLPVPWAWIICSIEVPPRVTQINLTSRDVGGSIPEAFGRLVRLTVLDLSNNRFNGSVPIALGNISSLRALNLERNELSGELPTFPARSLQNLEFLSVSNNRLTGNLSSLISALDDTLSTLDLSNNSLSGSIPLDISRLVKLKNLDVSNNNISGELKFDLVKLSNLQNLDLSNNHIAGGVPDNLWGNSTLAVANLEKNNFTELNLTTWYQSITKARSFEYGQIRKVRLVGNQIQRISLSTQDVPQLENTIPSPASEELQRLTLQNPAAFILLGDNPWCKDRGDSLFERYLCRSDESQNFWPPPASGKGLDATTVIIVAVVCGLVVVVIACALIYFIWRMQERTCELHQIQEALAKLHVQPPFFSYEDLKAATRNFANSSILGRGGFGIVFKADLADGSVLAVKKLNPTEQNTAEFLKEIVNITGIKHKHLIQLKGCCVREKWQRMLVYEYAENRSLAEALWGPDRPYVLSWKQRFNICLGIARGLAYLHEELQPMMVHRGYCSPEYLSEGLVSEKLDVYSYGVVLLEIVSGRRCINRHLPHDQIYLPSWAKELYEEDKLLSLVDIQLVGDYHEEEVLLIIHTALACCQLDAKKRPTMSQVMNKLVHQADIAIDILKELSTRKGMLERVSEDDIGDHMYDSDDREANEAEDRSLTFNSGARTFQRY